MNKPSIVLIGCPNSGTSIAAKLYETLGWYSELDYEVIDGKSVATKASSLFMHIRWLREPVKVCTATDDPPRIAEAREQLRQGFVAAIKPVIANHHGLVWCLDKLSNVILDIEPGMLLVLNEKDFHLVRRSTQLRLNRDDPNIGFLHRSIQSWIDAGRSQYQSWPGAKHIIMNKDIKTAVLQNNGAQLLQTLGIGRYDIDASAVATAISLFDPARDNNDNPHRGSDGWKRGK